MSGLPDEAVEAMANWLSRRDERGYIWTAWPDRDYDLDRRRYRENAKALLAALPAGIWHSDGQGKVEAVEPKRAERELSAIRHGLRRYCGNCRRDVEEVLAALSATDTESSS